MLPAAVLGYREVAKEEAGVCSPQNGSGSGEEFMPVDELVEGLIPSGALFDRKMFHRPSQSIQLKGLVIRDIPVVQVLENVWLRAPHINTSLYSEWAITQSIISYSRFWHPHRP